ncbi:SDR family oxidoreductase [Fervidicoccus fontis]|uniref:SDR family oxidoreductase n=1 Tax=Fervidicoccus fontis TaxID=683846 RepID=A0A7C2ZDC6_9CREN|nr:SDR family oxidoreductase [Fervidicoccus fontis]PMB76293.1 MAG: short-chain dehydrogenase [Fervidicoccus fontis]HEW63790.1 SDR family oxidoreductase [Fervidicoccus fontis]
MSAFNIGNTKVLVTASTRGIGFGIAKVLLENGAKVVINGRSKEGVIKAIEKLQYPYKNNAKGIVADISNKDEAIRLVKESAKSLGGLDSLVYVTGPPKPGYFNELNYDDWEEGVNLLINSAIVLAKESIPFLKESKNPSMIFLTSIAVKEPIPNIALSNVLRISVHGLVKTLSKELARYKIRVNAVLPGHIETERSLQLASDRAKRENRTIEEVLNDMTKEIPLGRLGKPEEIGYTVAFLISPYSSYITGAFIPVDGGVLRSI